MDRQRVQRAVEAAGLTLPDGFEFEIVGDDPVLPSPHRLGEGAAVARLLTGLAAARLWQLKTGRAQTVTVDMAHAAASLTSFAHLRFHDAAKAPQAAGARTGLPLYRILPAAGGRFVQLHGSFHDGPAILDELGVSDGEDQEAIAAAVSRRDAFELEEAFIRRGVCGGVVRSRREWAEHPQGRATAGTPVVQISRIGAAAPEGPPEGDRPASGVRVLDLTRVLAGPTAAKTLAEHGADVLHVTAPHLSTDGGFEPETGIGKRQAFVDLDDPDGPGIMTKLLSQADVFVQGYRSGTLERRGLGPEAVAELRPGIVYVSENCYGHDGPWATRPGWEQLAQAATGMSHREGEAAGTPPRLAPAAVNDYSTGFLAAYGAMMALAARASDGGSWHVRVSLSQTCRWYQDLGADIVERPPPLDVSAFLAVMDTPAWGPISYLAPAVAMSETQPRWDLPPVPLGSHEAEWLPRR